jgi:hypothetical protein
MIGLKQKMRLISELLKYIPLSPHFVGEGEVHPIFYPCPSVFVISPALISCPEEVNLWLIDLGVFNRVFDPGFLKPFQA